MKKWFALCLLVVFCLAATSCSAEQAEAAYVAPEMLRFAENRETFLVGDTYQTSLVVEPVDASLRLTWTSSDDTIATVDTKGRVTGVAPGMAVIQAIDESGLYAELVAIVEQ